MDEARIERVIDAAYTGALAPERWPDFLAGLAGLFRCHFADSFARADDYSWFAGTAFGLDEADYRDEFLGKWVSRNIWGRRRPVRVAGEIVTTREMVSKGELIRSDMHREYLGPRGLDEGLRLALRAEHGVIQDISLLRAWSAGPYDGEELAAARRMLPHLQRCAAVASRLAEASTRASAAEAGLEALRHPVLMLDAGGRAIHWNAAADRLLARRDGLLLERGGLSPSERKAANPLRHALGRASGAGPRKPRSASLSLSRSSGPPLRLTLLPVLPQAGWSASRRPSVLVLVDDPAEALAAPIGALTELFGLTTAEAEVARALASGNAPQQIAARSGRSLHTVRTLLARVMRKTRTTRQADLIRLLITLPEC